MLLSTPRGDANLSPCLGGHKFVPMSPGDTIPVPDALEHPPRGRKRVPTPLGTVSQSPMLSSPLPSLRVTKVAVSSVIPRACPRPPGDTGGRMGTPLSPPQVLGAMLGLGLFAVIVAAAIVVLVRRLRLKSE